MVDDSAEVVAVAARTCDVQRNEFGILQRPEGMSERDWNIHKDAMMPQGKAPIYLLEHYKRVELAQRIAGGAGADAPPAVKFIVNLLQAPKHYDVIDVTPIESKEPPCPSKSQPPTPPGTETSGK